MSARVDARRGVRRRAALWCLCAAALCVLAAACGAGRKPPPVQKDPSPTARMAGGEPAHVAVIVMENHEYGDIIGSGSAPYINSLAHRYGLATQMYAITHPSLPNYLALTGGSTFGIDSDCTDCSVGATSLVDQLAQARVSWRAYMEDLPRACFTGASADNYAKKHDPFAYFTRVTGDPARCANIVPLRRLAGARVRGRLSTPTDHYSVLQTIEDVLRLRRLRGAACACTPSLAALLAGG